MVFMIKKIIHKILLIFIAINYMHDARCQVTEKPAPPVVYFVTVHPETGFVKIVWIPSPSLNVHYYKILNLIKLTQKIQLIFQQD